MIILDCDLLGNYDSILCLPLYDDDKLEEGRIHSNGKERNGKEMWRKERKGKERKGEEWKGEEGRGMELNETDGKMKEGMGGKNEYGWT